MATVAQLIADMRGVDDITSSFHKGLRQLREIDAQLDRLMSVARPEDDPEGYDDWKLVYQTVFSTDDRDIGPRTTRALELTGFGFPSYCDPDTSYQADVVSWSYALRDVLERIEAHAETLPTEPQAVA